MNQTCSTCASLTGRDRCPFHTTGVRKQLSTMPPKGMVDACPQCGRSNVDVLDGFYDTENRAWHPACAVIALRGF
jgi:hypothetical protein